MTTQKAKTYWSLPGGGCSQELNHRGSLARRGPDTCIIYNYKIICCMQNLS